MGTGLVWIFPIYWWTTYDNKFLYKLKDYSKYWLKKESYILLNQYKTISLKRLVKKINDRNKIPLISIIELNNIISNFKSLFL